MNPLGNFRDQIHALTKGKMFMQQSPYNVKDFNFLPGIIIHNTDLK